MRFLWDVGGNEMKTSSFWMFLRAAAAGLLLVLGTAASGEGYGMAVSDSEDTRVASWRAGLDREASSREGGLRSASERIGSERVVSERAGTLRASSIRRGGGRTATRRLPTVGRPSTTRSGGLRPAR